MGTRSKILRERGVKAMKLPLVTFIFATVIIITMVKAGPIEFKVQLLPTSDQNQKGAGAYRSTASRNCEPRMSECYGYSDRRCCGRCQGAWNGMMVRYMCV